MRHPLIGTKLSLDLPIEQCFILQRTRLVVFPLSVIIKVISKYPNVDFLLRKSGTENLLRVMVQSKDEVVMNKVLDSFINLIKDIDE